MSLIIAVYPFVLMVLDGKTDEVTHAVSTESPQYHNKCWLLHLLIIVRVDFFTVGMENLKAQNELGVSAWNCTASSLHKRISCCIAWLHGCMEAVDGCVSWIFYYSRAHHGIYHSSIFSCNGTLELESHAHFTLVSALGLYVLRVPEYVKCKLFAVLHWVIFFLNWLTTLL